MSEMSSGGERSGEVDGEVGYAVDREDRIRCVNQEWSEFATANHGEHLRAPEILGVSLLDTIRDPATRAVYRALLQRVRGGAGAIRFRLRCDSPDARRLLEMRISPEPSDGVAFGVRTVSVQPRPHVSLLDPDEDRAPEVVTICSWCMRVATAEDEWAEIEEAVPLLRLFERTRLPRLSHGMCPACYEAMERSLAVPGDRNDSGMIELGIALPG